MHACSTGATQPDLFDYGATTQKTRSAAAKSARRKSPARQTLLLEFYRETGSRGATREEASISTGMLIQSVCGPTLALLRSGLLVETGQTRLTRNGSKAAVIVAAEFADPKG